MPYSDTRGATIGDSGPGICIFPYIHFMTKQVHQKGFTIAELMVVVFIISIAMVPLISALTAISVTTKDVENSIIANFLLKEAMDITRNLRDTDFASHLGDSNHGFGCFGNCIGPAPTPPAVSPDGYYTVNWNSTRLTRILSKNDPSITLKIDSDGMYNHTTGTNSFFSRVIGIKTMPQSGMLFPFVELRVIATVSWSDENKVTKYLIGEEHLFNFFKQ